MLEDPDYPGRTSQEYKPIFLKYQEVTEETQRMFWERLRERFREVFRKYTLPNKPPHLPGQRRRL